MKFPRKLVPIAILGGAVLVMLVLASMRPPAPVAEVTPRMPLVEVIELAERPAGFEVRSQGTVRPRTQTTLVSEVAGNVLEVPSQFAVGGFFRAGELILRVDPKDYEVALARAEAQLANRQALLAQETARAEQAARDWASIGRGTPTELVLRKPFVAEAEANVRAAEADLRAAEINLARTEIRAPFDGLLREKRVDRGQFVAMGTAIGVLAAVDVAEVRLPLTEADLAVVDLPEDGLAVAVHAPGAAQPGAWQGRLVRSEGVLDERTRVLHVVVEVVDPYGLNGTGSSERPLKFGTFVEGRIPGALSHPVIVLPRHVLRGMDQVLLADGEDRLRLRRIEVLRADRDSVYVASGLAPGERVVTTAIETPVEGMRLRVLAAEPTPLADDAVVPEEVE
ncbi:MAG TPA: efflux RND transporter periplasmic adaptor subunit [Xanthomonadaceae bacterium]|nr:efflux RND transporter periplasmic adaptor subunit [Xanthomonadaceae bacterium]